MFLASIVSQEVREVLDDHCPATRIRGLERMMDKDQGPTSAQVSQQEFRTG